MIRKCREKAENQKPKILVTPLKPLRCARTGTAAALDPTTQCNYPQFSDESRVIQRAQTLPASSDSLLSMALPKIHLRTHMHVHI